MKNLLLLIFCCFHFCSFGQVNFAMPAEAYDFYNKAMPAIKPAIRNYIKTNASRLSATNMSEDSLNEVLKKEPLLTDIHEKGLDALVLLMMVQASKDADNDLKKIVIEAHKTDDKPSSENSKKTELLIERKSKVAEMALIVLKRIAPSGESAINKLK